ncbi:sensor histidine kinase [Proteiniclasticum sp. C24MP]|uniref:sensor histidine kinase n=1 Tax=Proteiniclasticum sp. C24MP TaxID=3374101 RepID=UPI003754DE0C
MRYFKKDIIAIIVAVILVFLFSAIVDIRLDMEIFDRNRKMLEDYEEINETVMDYDQSRLYFRLYNRDRNANDFAEYQRATDKVTASLEELSSVFREDERSSMNYRIVSQMLEHRSEMIRAYENLEIQDRTLSKDLEYIIILSERVSTQLNSLASSYLNQMNDMNEKNLIWYQNRQNLSNALTFLILLSLIVLTLFIGRAMKKKLLEAAQVVSEIGNRNFQVKNLERTHYKDVNVYIDTMNDMKEEILALIAQTEAYARSQIQYEQQKRMLAESRMKELQLQINPHFLFNTLSIVIRHIQFKEYDTSIQLIKETSKILRSSLGKKKGMIPLDDEIDLLNSYIFIQQLHLKDRVEISLDVRKAYGNEVLEVPPLVIQPLVENAVMHGMSAVTSGGSIDIRIMERADRVEVEVEDNGKGIPQEIIEKVKSGTYEGHIGLLNVIRRLQLLYEREDVFELRSEEGKGTHVKLYLYKRRQKDV